MPSLTVYEVTCAYVRACVRALTHVSVFFMHKLGKLLNQLQRQIIKLPQQRVREMSHYSPSLL